jgi:hypothetical protein
MRTTTQMPNLTGARRTFNRGDLKQACGAALGMAREEQQTIYVGSNYGGYYLAHDERRARGTSNGWYEVEPAGEVTKVEDHPEREILVNFG